MHNVRANNPGEKLTSVLQLLDYRLSDLVLSGGLEVTKPQPPDYAHDDRFLKLKKDFSF